MRDDIAPTVVAPRGLELGAYIDALLERFRNGAVRHLLSQIAWDGSQKLPVRILATVRDAAKANRPLDRLAVPIAAWMRFLCECVQSGVPIVDPLADALAAIGQAATGDAAADVSHFLNLAPIFGDGLPAHYAQTLIAAYERLGERQLQDVNACN